LYGAIYAAFRQRRSLLLLNLEHQVAARRAAVGAALQPFRTRGSRRADARARRWSSWSFWRGIVSYVIPAQQAVAGDWRHEQSAGFRCLSSRVAPTSSWHLFGEFLRAASNGGPRARAFCYERYYDVPAVRVLTLNDLEQKWGVKTSPASPICASSWRVRKRPRARPCYNGTILEQEQILTTHNPPCCSRRCSCRVASAAGAGLLHLGVPPTALARKHWKARLQ